MTPEQIRRIERLKHYSTKYEAVMSHTDGRKMLFCYAPKSRASLLRYLDKHATVLVGVAQADRVYPGEQRGEAFRLGQWAVAFTGRTQRECIQDGELPWWGRA